MKTASPATATARARARSVRRVVATTDVHSSLDRAGILVRSLREFRAAGALIADCGDFFEGTGCYVLGRGHAETALLRGPV
jgi:2',3'-cyclic-nucleotide 2'-phosphodiesterase (5'-nucleotidase family)